MRHLLNVKKQKKEYILTFDNPDCEIRTKEDVIIKYGFIHKKDVSEEVMTDFLYDVAYYNYLYMACDYLKKMRSRNDVITYLLIMECDDDMARKIADQLEKMHLLNDALYADCLLNYLLKNHKGPLEVKMELLKHKISEEIIIDTLEKYDFDKENENVFYHLQHSFLAFKKSPYQKCIRNYQEKMQKKGFNSDIVKKVIEENRKVLDNISSDDNIITRDIEKALAHYQKKYSGYELRNCVIKSLLSKGYSMDSIKKYLD